MESEEVCIVLYPDCREYHIYIVDLSDIVDGKETNGLRRKNPALRITGDPPSRMAFSVINSTLYMFGGHREDKEDEWESKSFSYTLPPRSRGTPIITIDLFKDDDVKAISPMASFKQFPRAVLIGHRICVFSSQISPYTLDFELYDPDSNQWSPLPQPRLDFGHYYDRHNTIQVNKYYVEDLRLFITTEDGSFCIDFGNTESDWVTCDTPDRYIGYRAYGSVKDGGLLLSSDLKVTDTTEAEPKESHIKNLIPQPRVGKREWSFGGTEVTAVRKKENERLRACAVQSGLAFFEFRRRGCSDYDSALAIHLISFDAQANPSILKSHFFHTRSSDTDSSHSIQDVFPM